MKTIRTSKFSCLLAPPLVTAVSVVIAAFAHADTFTVVDSGEAGPGTLRQAILDANATPGTDSIAFNLPGSAPFSIQPLSQLPDVTDPVLIDGTTQPGFAGTPVIELNGAFAPGAASGLKILSGDSTVRGLAINGWTDPAGGFGVWLSGAGNNRIEGCYLGTDIVGAAAQGNNAGVFITGSDSNVIGGATPGTRNVISGNVGTGIQIDPGDHNVIQGNFIGTDALGTTAVPNGRAGVFIWLSGDNLVGGAAPAERNVVSGNSLNGVEIFAVSGPPNVVRGNYIGTDVSGSVALPNHHGVNSTASSAQQIGGTAPGAGNLISGNTSTGVSINTGVVEGNFIGTDHSGTAALGNGSGIAAGAGVRIGGNTAAARNLISGNLNYGVAMFGAGSFGNFVQGNFIGTDITGTVAIGNLIGVSAQQNPAGNFIGGTGPGEGNLISGNQTGVDIRSPDNRVQGNLIGTDLTGTLALGNALGVALYSPSADNLIGGSTPGARNVISGNSHRGVQFQGANGNRILGNLIGTDIAGGLPLGNGEGVVLVDSADNQVGGVNSGDGNTIAHSATDGVIVWNLGAPGLAVGNAIRGNAIFSNGGLGIDLGEDGPTANDPLDVDSGANQLQNHPVVEFAGSDGATTAIRGDFHGTPNASLTLDIFADSSRGNGQGERFLGSATVTTDNSGNANFILSLPVATVAGEWITATATDSDGNTSEFSADRLVQPSISVVLKVVDQHGQEIPGSRINVLSQEVGTGDSLLLPVGEQSFGVFPGIQGQPSNSTILYRTEYRNVDSTTGEIVFEWITSSLTARLRDQHGVDIPASQYNLTLGIGANAGDPVILPITDESVYPTLNGGLKHGYFIGWVPGLRGNPGSSTELFRGAEGPFELSTTPAEFGFEWITSSFTVRLRDQHGVDIPASTFWAPGTPGTLGVGEVITLPITDESVYPNLGGFYRDGYYTSVQPGIHGNPGDGTWLGRLEYNLELSIEPGEFVFEWIQHQCPLDLLSAANLPVPGSDLVLPPLFPDYVPGQAVTIPVNDAATYPSIGGYYASSQFGYWITVTPGDTAPVSSEIHFTLNASGEFTPGSFTIGGVNYNLVLGCDDGCGPLAVASLTAPAAPHALGTATTVTAHFAATDNDSGRICSFAWGDDTFDSGLDAGAESVAASHTYASPGVYRVTVTAENDCGDVDIAVHEFVVVYDPEGGFVTGGGWIHSPAGAYALDHALSRKANFGFVAKYHQGANVPSGSTEFQFKAGDLNFKSTSYAWLVVAGAKAKFKGSGRINGSGDYAFQITATDGQIQGGGATDRFRIKIWDPSGDGVIYDNQPGDSDTADATTTLGGGGIVIHKP